MSYATIWETLKAYLRGQIISYKANLNKACTQRLHGITHLFLHWDEQYAIDPLPDLYKQRLLLQAEHDDLTSKQEQLHLKARYRVYEQDD